MPKAMERKLKAEAAKHPDWSREHENAYVYGTMRKTGWKPKEELAAIRSKAAAKLAKG